MYHVLTTASYFDDAQHGFRPHRSCETQLAHTIGNISRLRDLRKHCCCFIFRLSKAFDSVSHRKLLFMLNRLGFHPEILQYIEIFLVGHLQYVALDNFLSTSQMVTSGAPQGPVLGPLLFLVYENDLPAQLRSFCRLFAGDVILYNKSNNRSVLKQDPQHLKKWGESWQMFF